MSGLGFLSGGGVGGTDPGSLTGFPHFPDPSSGGTFAGVTPIDVTGAVINAVLTAAATAPCVDLSNFAFAIREGFAENQAGPGPYFPSDLLSTIAGIILGRTDCSDPVKQEAVRVLEGGTPQGVIEEVDPTDVPRVPSSGSINQPIVSGSAQDPLGRIAPVLGATQQPAPTPQTFLDRLFVLMGLWARIIARQRAQDEQDRLRRRAEAEAAAAAQRQREAIASFIRSLFARGAQMPFGQSGFTGDAFSPGGGTIGLPSSTGLLGSILGVVERGFEVFGGVKQTEGEQVPALPTGAMTADQVATILAAASAGGGGTLSTRDVQTVQTRLMDAPVQGPLGPTMSQLYHRTPAGFIRANSVSMVRNPRTGMPDFFRHAGKPILFSKDAAHCKRVKKAGMKALRATGGRR